MRNCMCKQASAAALDNCFWRSSTCSAFRCRSWSDSLMRSSVWEVFWYHQETSKKEPSISRTFRYIQYIYILEWCFSENPNQKKNVAFFGYGSCIFRWWFQTFVYFPPIWVRFPIWLNLFRWQNWNHHFSISMTTLRMCGSKKSHEFRTMFRSSNLYCQSLVRYHAFEDGTISIHGGFWAHPTR